MGARGPAPKREGERIRANTDYVKVDTAEGGAGVPSPYAPDEAWHPVAISFYESLSRSGQSRFYEESDWAKAYFLCEAMSRELKPQFIGWEEGTDASGNPFKRPLQGKLPVKGASLSAIGTWMTTLLVTESDRRRSSIELSRAAGETEIKANPGDAAVVDLKARLGKKKIEQAK